MEMHGDGTASWSETTLFVEKNEAKRLISTITSSSNEKKEAVESFASILDRYLEAPTLLDPHLAELVMPLGEYCRSNLNLECRYGLSAIYSISKVRGRKQISRYLPPSMDLVEPVFHLLEQFDDMVNRLKEDKSSELVSCFHDDESDSALWKSIYVLWMWLQLLSLTPFDRRLVLQTDTIPSLLKRAQNHLAESGPIRDTAAACLASWLARQDMQECHDEFCQWSCGILGKWSLGTTDHHTSVFLSLGILQTLTAILDVGSRSDYLAQLPLWHCMLELSENQQNPNVLIRKYICKWLSRMGCAHLPPRIASWRYQRGGRTCLVENLLGKSKPNQVKSTLDQVEIHQDESELFEVPDAVEDVMGQLLLALKDKATVVRWSAAKGIGRVTERLPVMCAHDVLDALLDQLTKNRESDSLWHGSCLTLAELARRGLLLADRLPDVIEPILIPAILFDIRKGRTSVGSNVRDAACYTYWAFARAYSPAVLKPHVARMSQSLVLASLFDRELNCRRAASAAFQESVGRQGAQNFPHGIDILTAADYFTLGNRNDSYLRIAPYVAGFEEYRKPIIDHLQRTKLFHWDIDIRTLASKSLGELAPMDSVFTLETVIPHLLEKSTNSDLCVRHGAVLGLSEIVLSFQNELPALMLEELSELVAKLEKLRLYRGRGGEIMRGAVCRYIERISLAQIPLTVKQQVRLLDSVDENLRHPNEDIQMTAGFALAALMRSYFPVRETGPSDRLQRRVVDKYVNLVCTSDNPAESRGFALALGSLPKKILAPSVNVLDFVLNCLIKAARFDTIVGSHGDAETRRNAFRALVSVTREVSFSESRTPPQVALSSQQLEQIFECFLLGMQDYNTDRRGDIGSWSRIESMTGLKHIIFLAIENGVIIDVDLMTKSVGGMLKQLSEKLDNVRLHAGLCIQDILRCQSPQILALPFYDELCASLQVNSQTNWSEAKVAFRRIVKALKIQSFFQFIVAGLVVSVGALTESVTKEAEEALIGWVRNDEETDKTMSEKMEKLGTSFLRLFQENKRKRRVVLPLLKTLEKLFDRGMIDVLLTQTDDTFAESLLLCIQTEVNGCTDVYILLSAVSVALSLLSPTNDVSLNSRVFEFVLGMLRHDFPRVRQHTADNLYVRLLEVPSLVQSQNYLDELLHLLLQGHWRSDTMGDQRLNELCSNVAHFLGVQFKISRSTLPKKKRAPETFDDDDFATYSSLVHATF